MNSQSKNVLHGFSTPKRKRLGTGRIIRSKDGWRENFIANSTPLSQQIAAALLKTPDRCESPPLPCNQVEYIRDSGNNSVCSDIPCSPGVEDLSDFQDWKSLYPNKSHVVEKAKSVGLVDEISSEMFESKLEMEMTQNQVEPTEEFIQEVENAFDAVNQSIAHNLNNEEDNLFDTKDSFLLDIQTGVVLEESNHTKEANQAKSVQNVNSNDFYGLPVITRGLFKTYRNIEKFYGSSLLKKCNNVLQFVQSQAIRCDYGRLAKVSDPRRSSIISDYTNAAKISDIDRQHNAVASKLYWQEECLNLDAIKERQNLIYALPTSGGKTLVAEVLMLREVLIRKKNALFILPFVAIVQEKIWALSPFAVQLDFLVEEYAAGKGHLPPKKRRKKNSIYIATIEKGLALIRSLMELDRLQEIGLIVVDELHLIGEPGRGATLEILLTTVLFVNKGIQIVGMSATIGNLAELAAFLRARVFQRHFRPVQLREYVKLGPRLHRLVYADAGLQVVPERDLAYDYSAAATSLDPDCLGGLVAEVVPADCCLVFCPTKRNCENVAALLCKLQRKDMLSHRTAEREALSRALRAEGANSELARAVRCGVAFHHAGLAADERALLEQAFRSGVISVVCCTSTLAAGVNLPARRVIIRAPRVARRPLELPAYRQMAGRAGRAGICDTGESILICPADEWCAVRAVLAGALPAVRSALRPALAALLLPAAALRLPPRQLLAATLLAAECDGETDIEQLCNEELRRLMESGVLEPSKGGGDSDTDLVVSPLGLAAIKGCLELNAARQLLEDLEVASRGLVLMGSLHLLYLVTPHDAAGIKPDYRHYYSLYCNFDEEGIQTAKVLGITEVNAIRMMTGKPITNVSEQVLCRFYLALMLHDLWKQVPFPVVADKYMIPRGTVQAIMSSAASFAAGAQRFCESLERWWAFAPLFQQLAERLRHCAAPELQHLMELPNVRKARALQLSRAGYKRIEDLAKASAEDLMSCVAHLSRTAANHLISAARMMLIEKVENLRAEAEDVMEELKV